MPNSPSLPLPPKESLQSWGAVAKRLLRSFRPLTHESHTTTTATAVASILAIDLGRFKSIACVDDRRTRATGRAEFERLIARHSGARIVV